MKCGTVEFLVQQAYYIFASGVAFKGNVTHDSLNPIEGGPAWIKSARYDINATAEGTPTMAMMRGPMMQALLEDRFKLKIHRETRDVPAYALTVAKNGLKLQRRECTPQPGQRLPNACGNVGMQDGVFDHYGISMTEFSQDLRNILNRPIIDKTGVTGIFDFHLKYLANEIRGIDPGNPPGAPGRPPASDSAFYPSIFTAVQEQLGLKLEQARGPDEFLVIDQVEKPSDN